MSRIPVYEIDLELGNIKVTLLTTEKPKTYSYGQWEEENSEPVGFIETGETGEKDDKRN